MTAPTTTQQTTPLGRRLWGVDAARGVALIGMMATHLLSRSDSDPVTTFAFTAADGRASALFAVLAGMSLALADGGAGREPRRPFPLMVARVAVRAVLIGVMGMVLALVDPPILVILTYYAVTFLLVAPLLRLPVGVLATLGIGWAILGPVVSHLIRLEFSLAGVTDQPSFTQLVTDPGGLLRELLLTGTYPAGTWVAYALVGAALGRAMLTPAKLRVLAGAGLALALASWAASRALQRAGASALAEDRSGITVDSFFYGTTPTSTWWWLVIDRPHSGTPFDMLATIGSAVLVITVLLMVFGTEPRRGLRWLSLTGSMTLTLYSLHVVSAALGLPPGLGPVQTWLVHVVAGVALAALWRSTFRRGPLEAVVAAAVNGSTRR